MTKHAKTDRLRPGGAARKPFPDGGGLGLFLPCALNAGIANANI